jgi:glycyl-tRNA synthetase (class II)
VAPYQVTLGVASNEVTSDLLDFVRYLHLLLEGENIQVWMPDQAVNTEELYDVADQLGIPYVIVVPVTALENGVVRMRDRETAWFEEIHAAHLTQRMVKIFQGKVIEDTWSKILARKKMANKDEDKQIEVNKLEKTSIKKPPTASKEKLEKKKSAKQK